MTAADDRRSQPPIQAEAFWRGEGDAWFHRNREDLPEVLKSDMVLKLLDQTGLAPKRVIEIGASNGYRLAEIHRRFSSYCLAVEPSVEAIEDGRSRYPEVEFRRGLTHELPVEPDETFDLAIVHFVLHWVDRSLLLRSVDAIDRVLVDGGHLLLGDFLPDQPCMVRYHHLPDEEVFTYKQDYPALFAVSQLYVEQSRIVYEHGSPVSSSEDSMLRCVVSCLRKDMQARYVERSLPNDLLWRRS